MSNTVTSPMLSEEDQAQCPVPSSVGEVGGRAARLLCTGKPSNRGWGIHGQEGEHIKSSIPNFLVVL